MIETNSSFLPLSGPLGLPHYKLASYYEEIEKYTSTVVLVREVCGKSKWKFKMAFAMKGGGLEGVSFAIKLF